MLGKFGSPSRDDPTVFSHYYRERSASGMVLSEDPRVIDMAFGISVHYFACWDGERPFNRCATHYSSDNHLDYYFHYLLGNQPIFVQGHRSLRTVKKSVVYFDCFGCGRPQAIYAVYFEQHLLHQPKDSLFP
jgi:hypothetical protein